MELSLITANQVIILFVMMAAGFIGAKAKILTSDGKKTLSDLLLYIVTPALIVNSYIMDFDKNVLKNLFITLGLTGASILIGLFIILIITKGMKNRNKPIVIFACTFSNAVYMGFPLIQALFGSEGMIYASAYVTMFNILLWTVGYITVTGDTTVKSISKSILSSPVIYAVILGLTIYLLQIPVPSFVKEPLSILGGVNTPLSMIITGMIIANSNLKKMITNKLVYLVILIRMIVVPAICLGVVYITGLSGMAIQVIIMLTACPTASITSVFAIKFGYDEELAAGAVVATTLLSIIFLPLCAFLV